MLKTRHCLALLLTLGLATQPVVASQSYTVKPGDSLSSIAANKLGAASRWREVWALNPEIRQPEQLSVGMRLQIPENGETVSANTHTMPAPVMSRTTADDKTSAAQLMAEEMIASGRVAKVQARFQLLDNDSKPIQAYAVRNEQDGVHIYANNLQGQPLSLGLFDVFQPSLEPATNQAIELIHIGQARVATERNGMAGFRMVASQTRPQENAVLLPHHPIDGRLKPSHPEQDANAQITKVLYEQPEGIVLLLNQGTAQGLQSGHLLRLHQRNPVTNSSGDTQEFPGKAAGWAMVVNTSTNASWALVLSAQRVPAVGDRLH